MRSALSLLSVVALVACGPPPVQETARGVGFESYDTYLADQQRRNAQLARGSSGVVQTTGGSLNQTPEQQTAAAAVAAVRPAQGVPVQTTPPQVVPVRTAAAPARVPTQGRPAGVNPGQNNPGLSDEQDFQAVSSRQSIQSDAQRRAEQSAQYQVVAPTAVPNRPNGVAPTPIEFALETRHPVGERVYRRGVSSRAKAQRACAGYSSSELAQDAFLKSGGPDRDRFGLDPDGDGYACSWNPDTYRGLVRQ